MVEKALEVLRKNYISRIPQIEDPAVRIECAELCAQLALALRNVDDIEVEEGNDRCQCTCECNNPVEPMEDKCNYCLEYHGDSYFEFH